MTAMLSVLALAGMLATPAPSAPALCSTAPAAVMQAGFDGGGTDAVCIAYCGELNPSVSCNYASSCSAVDQSCPTQRGYVVCDGVTTYCAACCTDGQIKNVITGPSCSCEEPGTTPRDRYLCVNGTWEYQYSYCGGPFCPVW